MTAVIEPSAKASAADSLSYVFLASNAEAQRLIASLLGRFDDLSVRTSGDSSEPLVVVECADTDRAQALHDIVVTIDWGAQILAP